MTRDTIRAAAAKIRGDYVLIGTAALLMRGYNVDPHDIDFLVAKPQLHLDKGEREPASTADSVKSMEDGVPVDYVFADEVRVPFLKAPGVEAIDGVRVAAVETILAIKVFAGRAKDHDFLALWRAGRITVSP